MYSFNNRLKKLISIDNIRLFKIFELIQYTVILYLLVIIVSYFLDNYIISYDKNENIWMLLLSSLIDMIIIIVAIFYLRKIALLVPSIPHLLYPKFKGNTTFDYSFQIAIGVVFIEFLPPFINKIKRIVELLHN